MIVSRPGLGRPSGAQPCVAMLPLPSVTSDAFIGFSPATAQALVKDANDTLSGLTCLQGCDFRPRVALAAASYWEFRNLQNEVIDRATSLAAKWEALRLPTIMAPRGSWLSLMRAEALVTLRPTVLGPRAAVFL